MRLPQISGFKLMKILTKFEFKQVRQRGSHVVLEKKDGSKVIRLTVPMHDRLKKGTLSRIIKDSKINEEELSRYL